MSARFPIRRKVIGAEEVRRGARAASRRSGLALTLLLAASSAAGQVWEVGNRLLARPQPGSYDSYGHALASGDFDGDGFVDLAVGVTTAGIVDVYRGGASGLGTTPWRTLHQQQASSGFGGSLAAGNFDDDAADELAVGAISFDLVVNFVLVADAGAVHVFDLDGETPVSSFFSQATTGVPGSPEPSDFFGSPLAVGDFDADGYDDLAISAVVESIAGQSGAGAVTVLYGTAGGLAAGGAQTWYRSGGGIDGVSEASASLGSALAAGDFDSDGRDDLAIGVPGSTIDAAHSTGEVVVLFGSAAGLDDDGQQQIDPVDLGVTAHHQGFGSALAAGEFNPSIACAVLQSCADDLAIGAPEAEVPWSGGTPWAGRVHLLLGSETAGGLDPSTDAPVDQSSFDPVGATAPEFDDHFGSKLLAVELDGRWGVELVVGTSLEAFDGVGKSGCAHLLYGASGTLAARSFQLLFPRTGWASAPQQEGDRFGGSFAGGDFDGDGVGDLALGLSGRDRGGETSAGVVQILYGALFADGFERGDPSGWSAAN